MDIPIDVEAILDEGESIDYRCQASVAPRLASSVLSSTVLYAFLGIGWLALTVLSGVVSVITLPDSLAGDYRTGTMLVLGVLVMLGVWRMVKVMRTERTYYVTEDKVVTFVESPSESSVSYVEISTIQNIELRRDRFEKWFDSATVYISTQRGYTNTSLTAIEPGAEVELIETIRPRIPE